MAIVQSVSSTVNSAASITQTISATGAGNLLLITATETNSGVSLTPSVAAGTAQSFTSIASANSGGTGFLQAWYVPNCAAGTTQIKVTRSSGSGQWTITVMEVSAITTSTPLDKSASSTSSGTTGTTATTTQANEFWFAVFLGASSSGATPTFSALAAGWTQDQTIGSTLGGANTDVGVLTAYKTVSATGTANATCTVTGAAGNGVAGIVATFKSAGAAVVNNAFLMFM